MNLYANIPTKDRTIATVRFLRMVALCRPFNTGRPGVETAAAPPAIWIQCKRGFSYVTNKSWQRLHKIISIKKKQTHMNCGKCQPIGTFYYLIFAWNSWVLSVREKNYFSAASRKYGGDEWKILTVGKHRVKSKSVWIFLRRGAAASIRSAASV